MKALKTKVAELELKVAAVNDKETGELTELLREYEELQRKLDSLPPAEKARVEKESTESVLNWYSEYLSLPSEVEREKFLQEALNGGVVQ